MEGVDKISLDIQQVGLMENGYAAGSYLVVLKEKMVSKNAPWCFILTGFLQKVNNQDLNIDDTIKDTMQSESNKPSARGTNWKTICNELDVRKLS